jgi:hypothetical protein
VAIVDPFEQKPRKIVDPFEAIRPQNATVLGAPTIPAESREDELRRKAQEDIVAGMGTGERLAASVGRGLVDAYQAGKQIAIKATENNAIPLPAADLALRLAPDSFKRAIERQGKDLNEQVRREDKEFEQGLGQTWTGWGGRLIGNAAATAPLGGPGAGASFLGNVGRAAASAGVGSMLTTPVKSDDFVQEKLLQGAVGSAGGALGSTILQGAGKAAERIGLGNLVRTAYNALGSKSAAKPEAVAAEAAAKKWGVPMSPAKITGDQRQLAVENTVGQSIWQRSQMHEQDMLAANKYAEAIGKNLDNLSKGPGDTVTAGNAVRNSVNEAVDKLSRRRAKLAEADFADVDKIARGTPVIAPDNYKSAAQRIIDENSIAPEGSDAHALAGAAKKLLDTADNNGAATNALKTRRYLSQIAGGQASFAGQSGQPIQKRAATMLLGALDQDIEAATGKGGALGDALKLANSRYRAYSQRIADIEDGVLGRILGPDMGTDLTRVAGETIYKRFTEMPPSQLSQAMKLLKPESAEAVKRAYVQRALEAAEIPKTNTAAQAAVTPSTFVKALQGDGETGAADRATLKAIFSDSELKDIDELMDIGRRLGDRTGRNTSESTVRAEAVGLVTSIKDGLLKWGVSTLGQALGAREIAKIYASNSGRKALLKLRKLPRGSAEARKITEYLSGLAAAKETDD